LKLWIDDVRPAPEGYVWVKSVNAAKKWIMTFERRVTLLRAKSLSVTVPTFEIIDIDHDAGDYARDGGDYIKLLDWLEETGRNYPIRIHSANAVGIANMRRIIQRNGWREVF
jgi:hypothetical protein